MAVESLQKEKKAFQQQYSTRDLFDLVFTDYKDFPSELAKIPSLESYAKKRVSQIVNAVGLQAVGTLKEFFSVVNEVEQAIAAQGGVTTEQITQFIDTAGVAATDTGISSIGGGG